MDEFFNRHERVALLFSGGRDSLACLLLCRAYWDRLDVVWVNAGNPYPETLEQMERIASMVPNFAVVSGAQPAFIREHGYPLDVVPISMTPVGRIVGRTVGVKVVPFSACCAANLWQPGARWVRDGGYTGVIRGDKATDAMRPEVRSGDVVDGVEYLFPLEAMSQLEVHTLVLESGLMPAQYLRGVETSLDCMNCTAYLEHNAARIEELRTQHPGVHAEVHRVLDAVEQTVARHAGVLATILERKTS